MSDILIRGMEMPTSCGKCNLFDASHAIGLFSPLGWCHVNGKEIFRLSEKADFCPLVPVPQHGDLIGRNWLIDIALHLMNTAKNDDIYNGVKWLLQYIIDSPTIIPAEEGE